MAFKIEANESFVRRAYLARETHLYSWGTSHLDPHTRRLELLRRAQAGDADALGALLDEYRETLRLRADAKLGGRIEKRVDRSDVVQRTFLNACRAFDAFRGAEVAEFAGWLERIFENTIAAVYREHAGARKRTVDQEESAVGDEVIPNAPAGESTPSRKAMKRERNEQLERALSQLPDSQREAVRLRHFEGRPLAEIAIALGKTPTAAAGLIKRGMTSLRRILHEQETQHE